MLTRPVALLFLFVAPVFADYNLPPASDRVVLRAETWQLDSKTLRVQRGEDAYAFSIDMLWLADRVLGSYVICAGGWEERAEAYLADLAARPTALTIELIKSEGSDWFAAGIWPAEQDFEQALQAGVPGLLSAEQVRELGDEVALRQRLNELSDAAWQRLRDERDAEPQLDSGAPDSGAPR